MKPQEVSDAKLAFPANISELIPPYESIPEEYKGGSGWGIKLFNDWFYYGLKSLKVATKEGIDGDMAMRHIRVIMGSYEPKHEHKEAAVAYLFELWFERAVWEAEERSKT